jgi:hypothetical protein
MATNPSPRLNARTLRAMRQAFASSTMGMGFTSGFTAMGGNIGGCDIGRLEEKNRSPLEFSPKSHWAVRGKSGKNCASSWKPILTHPLSAGPQICARSSPPRTL